MCGIAGIHRAAAVDAADRGRVQHMVSLLRHRGPDGSGLWNDRRTTFGHARLSIIDLEGGAQPLSNADGSIWLTFNGEIFNYLELREELKRAGYQFATQSDTEVIVHAYEHYGDAFVDLLNGQFAFALWDGKKHRLLLGRDRVGIAPLFYCQEDKDLYFSSSMKALLAVRTVPPSVNPRALHQLATFWSTLPPETLFDGICELPPGSLAVLEQGKIAVRRYWRWRFPDATDLRHAPPATLAQEFRSHLSDATRLRLRADVPVGAYLSGGLDSSTIAAELHDQGASLKLFSLEFGREGYDESSFQHAMRRQLGTEASSTRIAETAIAELLEGTITYTETPLVRTGPVPLGQLSKLVRAEGYKVVLTGEGADEVMGGYDIFKEVKVRDFVARDQSSNQRPRILQSLYPYLDFTSRQSGPFLKQFFAAELKEADPLLASVFGSHATRWNAGIHFRQFLADEVVTAGEGATFSALGSMLPDDFARWHPFNRAQYLEATLLLNGYILAAQGDRMLMRHSVEGRFPFLDHHLIEFANELHPNCKMPALTEKAIIKRAYRHTLPRSIIKRPKQPYRASGSRVKGNPVMQALVSEQLSTDALARSELFASEKVRKLTSKLERIENLSFRDETTFITVLTTQLWHRQFIQDWHRYRYQP